MLILPILAVMISSAPLPQQQPLFTSDERTSVISNWAAPGCYTISFPQDALARGVLQVHLTPEGSEWLYRFQAAVGTGFLPPTISALDAEGDRSAWKIWVQARLLCDRRAAQAAADSANLALQNSAKQSAARATPLKPVLPGTGAVADPGPIPASLQLALGNPPVFASAVTPMQYTVTFGDAESFAYTDNVTVPTAYAYYRFRQGVVCAGTMHPEELAAACTEAGMSASEMRIAAAVSKLEGTFEAVNTYDTGYLSVGFLQFITLDDGKHSLAEVLKTEKRRAPEEFAKDFHRYGIDVNNDGTLTVLDPTTGAELSGKDAVLKTIDDKRLTAVFQRAGRHSTAFRSAQIHVARSMYWPAEDPISIQTPEGLITGKVSDVVKSEAGMATLFDRKVNRGSCAPISDLVGRIVREHHLKRLSDASKYERAIIAQLRYRADFLNDATLAQPE